MKKRYIFPIAIVVLVIVTVLLSQRSTTESREIVVEAAQGMFVVDVTTTGELNALRSVRIMGPSRARNFRINQIKIESLVDEGTVVKKGEKVAELDRSELFGRMADAENNLDKAKSLFEQTKLDTAINLRSEREKIINLRYALQEKELVLEQSQFEPPATVKQNEISLEKAKRELIQALESYELKQYQSLAKMREVAAELRKEERDYNEMKEILGEFTILAPQDGMVIYEKSWDGSRIATGSQIGAWNPVVATLPDLTEMISTTYVNEVDIRKVKVGQKVKVGLDAYPDKKLTGTVMRVANVGQQNPNSDSKVFEVTVKINERDPALRPAMTTSNNIIVLELDSVVSVPLEAIRTFADSIQYVVLESGAKQEIEMGLSNANEAQILQGLTAGTKVLLSYFGDTREGEISLLASLDGKRNKDNQQQEVAEIDEEAVPAARRGGGENGQRPR